MDKTQEEKFEKWLREYCFQKPPENDRLMMRDTWSACVDANGIGSEPIDDSRYRIGEEVEIISILKNKPPRKAYITAFDEEGINCYNEKLIRRIPAWTPKEGEAVLFDDDGRAMAGFIKNGILYSRGLMAADWEKRERVKPFDASKIGKPWSEI